MKALSPAYIKIIKIEPRCFHAISIQQFFHYSQRIAQRLCPKNFTFSFFDTYGKVLKSTEVLKSTDQTLWWLSLPERGSSVLPSCHWCKNCWDSTAGPLFIGPTFPPCPITTSMHYHRQGQSSGDGSPEKRCSVLNIWDFCVRLTQDFG